MDLYFIFFIYSFLTSSLSKVLYYRRFYGNYYPRYDYVTPSSDICDIGVDCLSSIQNYSSWMTTSPIYLLSSVSDYSCSSYKIFGGNSFGKTDLIQTFFYNIPNHSAVDISFDFFKLDNWANEEFRFWVDDNLFSTMLDNNNGTNICGNNLYNENIMHIMITLNDHNISNLTLNFQSFQYSSTGTYGIKNLEIYLTNSCAETCLTCDSLNSSQCITCPNFATLNPSGACECKDKFYMNITNFTHCAECDVSCLTCDGPMNFNCKSCYAGDVIDNGTCKFYKTLITSEFPGSGFDINALALWTVTKSTLGLNYISSDCGIYMIVGGYDNFGIGASLKRNYTLPTHQYVVILFDFYKLDSWEDEIFTIDVNSIQRNRTYGCDTDGIVDRNFCGRSFNDQVENIYEVFEHTSSSLILKFYTNLNQNPWDESWGINNLVISVFTCYYGCASCIGPLMNQCLNCTSGYIYTSALFSCDLHCPFGFFNNTNSTAKICLECDASCLSCSGSSSLDCTSCSYGLYLVNSKCESCDSNCSACSIDPQNCTECSDKFYLFNNICVETCPSGYFQRMIDNTCQKCDNSCIECNDTTQFSCTQCSNSQVLVNNGCLSCDLNCLTCEVNTSNCISCSSGRFLLDNQCIYDCPIGKWPNTINNICSSCDSSCYKCLGGSASDCIECLPSQYLENNECSNCSNLCKTCQLNNSNCQSCNSGMFLTNNNTCVNQCYTGYWGNPLSNLCESCNQNCLNCTDQAYDSCISCYEGYYLSVGECLKCDTNCKNCNETSSYCLDCNSNTYLFENKCYDECPEGFLKNDVLNYCALCDQSCLTCFSPGTSNNCLSCFQGFYFINNNCLLCDNNCNSCDIASSNCTSCPIHNYLHNYQCIASCPIGYYGSIDGLCLPCDDNCLTCFESSMNDCFSCKIGQTLVRTHCELCDSSCLTCKSLGSSNCLSCNSSMYLQEGSCLMSCDKGFYPVELPIKVCNRCSSSCYECVGEGNDKCISCIDSYYLNIYDFRMRTGECFETCPEPLQSNKEDFICTDECNKGEYFDIISNECQNCFLLCEICDGPTYHNCKTCRKNLYLFNNTCLLQCPEQFFKNYLYHFCDSCPSNCKTCNNTELCLNCMSNYYLQIENSQCIECSEEGKYKNETDKTCRNCTYGCSNCFSETNCINCQINFYLDNYMCKEKTYIMPYLTVDTDNPLLYYLSFNDTWSSFFENLNNNKSSISLILENVQLNKYKYLIKQNNEFNNTWEIQLSITTNLSNLTTLLRLTPPNDTLFNLVVSYLSVSTQNYVYCGLFEYYNYNNKTCVQLQIISPKLLEIDSKKIILSFSDNFPDLFKILFNVTIINIPEIHKNDYNVTLKSTDSILNYDIILEYNETLIFISMLTVNFNLPSNLAFHPKYALNPTSISLTMKNITQMQSPDEIVNFQQNFESFTQYIFLPLSIANLLFFHNSMSYQGLLTLKFIKFLRYLNLDYPYNALSVFSTLPSTKISILPFNVWSNVSNNESNSVILPNNFRLYNINTLILVNVGDELFLTFLIVLIGVFFNWLNYLVFKGFKSQNKTHDFLSFFIKAIKLFNNAFFMNLFLMLFFNYLVEFSFFSLTNIYYNEFYSNIGIINFLIALLMIPGTIILFLYIFKLLKEFPPYPPYEEVTNDLKSTPTPTLTPTPTKQILKKNPLDSLKESLTKKSNMIHSQLSKSNWWLNTRKSNHVISVIVNSKKVKFNENVIAETMKQKNIEKLKKLDFDGIKILTRDFNNESLAQEFFIFFSLIRFFVAPFFLVIIENQPYFSSFFILILHLLIFIYLLISQPYKSKWNFIESLFLESCLIVSICGVFAIANDKNNQKGNINKGWAIFSANYIGVICGLMGLMREFVALAIEKVIRKFHSKVVPQ